MSIASYTGEIHYTAQLGQHASALRVRAVNGPELKPLASVRFDGDYGRVSEVGHVHFSSAP